MGQEDILLGDTDHAASAEVSKDFVWKRHFKEKLSHPGVSNTGS